jgi:ubiquinone/menaquinone biosynthesis C-methylase UbiE
MNNSEKFWDRISNIYARQPISNEIAYAEKIEKIKSYLKLSDTMIDFGCGTGTMSIELSRNVKEIFAIDISSKMLQIAQQKVKDQEIENIVFRKTSVFDTQLLPNSFDVVLAFNILHFIDSTDHVLNRINQLLKPGGHLITETPCMGEHKTVTNKIMLILSKTGLVPHLNLLTFKELENAVVGNGFNIIEKENLSEPPRDYLIFAKKSLKHNP